VDGLAKEFNVQIAYNLQFHNSSTLIINILSEIL